MNILVTGANGQLGNEMRILAKECQDKYIFTDVNQVEGLETTFLDITNLLLFLGNKHIQYHLKAQNQQKREVIAIHKPCHISNTVDTSILYFSTSSYAFKSSY